MQKRFDPKVFQLGYVTLATPDLERTKDHYLRTLGMNEVARGDDGSVYLSIGYNHHDLVLRPADEKALVHVGFQLKPHITVADFVRDAQAAGLAATVKTDSQPGVAEVVEIAAPGGVMIQFYSAMEAPAPGFRQVGVSPLRLGHVAIISPEGGQLVKFFQDFLGFWLTDDIAGIANFLTCNRDHHVINIVGVPESRVHHVAYELRDTAHARPRRRRAARRGRKFAVGALAPHSGSQRGGLSPRPRQGNDRALHRDGRLHPRAWNVRAPAVARACSDEAKKLGLPRAERLGSGLRFQSRRRLRAPPDVRGTNNKTGG